MADPIRILILEDNELDAELVLRQLTAGQLEGERRVVANERDYRAALRDFAPHVIISDFSLPGFDGLSALRLAAAEAPGTPFVFVSGTIGEERAIEALKRGAADYVLKDNLNRLVPAIRAALRQAEIVRERDLAEEMLRAREARLRDIIDTSHAWIWECDAERRYTFSSPSVERILGYAHHDVLGRDVTSYCVAEDREPFVTLFDSLRNGRSRSAQTTLRCRSSSGEARWIERDVVAVHDENGRFLGLRGADRDVTDRKTQELRIERLNRALAFLSEANSAMLRIRSREEVLEEACRIAVRLGGYAAATIYLRPAEGDSPIVRRAVSAERTRALPKEGFAGDGQVARAMRTGLVTVTEEDPSSPERSLLRALGLHAAASFPLLVDRTPVGVLQLHSADSEVFEEAEVDLLRQVANNIAFALQYLHNKDAARFLQYFDHLTSLPKRGLYLQRLKGAIERARNEPRAVVVIDVKNLSVVNDSLGRGAGDLALQLVAERLKGHYGQSRSLAYLGAGTYAAVHDRLPVSADPSRTLIADLQALFNEPFELLGQELQLSIRAGIAIYPEDGDDAPALLHRAETALARARAIGEGYLRHNATLNVLAAERLTLTGRLRRAVAERQLSLHYQPKASLASGRVEGVEALLRWRDGDRGYIPPDRFVPMLEAEGLMDDVGLWVIGQALEESAGWRGADGNALAVAVNVSPVQLRRPDFARRVLDMIARKSEPSLRLEIEITESTLMESFDETITILSELRERGVSIQIDDFGTGYSSLRMLSRLPVDALKIDRSFVANLQAPSQERVVVETTISLAKALGLKTIAEGVETKEQLEALKELGCASVQGYLIRPPLPAAELDQWFAATGGLLPAELAAHDGAQHRSHKARP